MNFTKETSSFANHGWALQNPSMFDTRGLVAGTWRHASSNDVFPVYEPSTGLVLEHCANFGRADFIEAIDSAYTGYQAFYSSTTAKERGSILRRWNDLILANIKDCKTFR